MKRFFAMFIAALMLFPMLPVFTEETYCEEFERLFSQPAELSETVEPGTAFIGQVISFDSASLDGDPVSSADLFRDNKITLVNLWGTWCDNCLDEMGELAKLHIRLLEKGCGIVGVESERVPIEEVAETARRLLEDKGVCYPNVIMPENNPVFDQVSIYPASFFVDSEGKILAPPITGTDTQKYESVIEKFLTGEEWDVINDAGAAKNESGTYHVIVCDQNSDPVKDVLIQLCDDSTCTFQKTNEDGVAIFEPEEQKAYDVHVLQAPEGYDGTDEVYKTLETWSDVNIILTKAE